MLNLTLKNNMKNMYKKKKGEPKLLTVGCVAVCEITTELQFPLYLLQNLCFFLYDYALFLQDLPKPAF